MTALLRGNRSKIRSALIISAIAGSIPAAVNCDCKVDTAGRLTNQREVKSNARRTRCVMLGLSSFLHLVALVLVRILFG